MRISSKTWRSLTRDQQIYLLELAAVQNWMGSHSVVFVMPNKKTRTGESASLPKG